MYHNRTSILIFFSILQLIYSNSDSDEENYDRWSSNGALIQTQATFQEKQFPSYVRISHTYHYKKVYFGENEHGDGIITFAMCPKPDTSHSLGRYCNFPGESFPVGKYARDTLNEICPMTVEPAMEKVIIGSRPPTHEECANDGHRYNFLYYRCKSGRWNRAFLKRTLVYNACYNETQKQLVYGQYWIATPNLLTNPLLKGEREYQFEFQTYPYFRDFLNHFENVAEYLYARNIRYVQRMILPPELQPFALQRKPLYHYMNLAPMDRELLSDWKFLMKKLKYKIAEMNGPIRVTAGLLGILNGNQYLGEIFLQPENEDEEQNEDEGQNEQGQGIPEIPIPDIWWILLYNSSKSHGVVIMMHNEPYNYNMNENYYDRHNCSWSLCNIANVASAIPGPDNHPSYMYCCHPYAVTGEFGIDGENNLLQLPN